MGAPVGVPCGGPVGWRCQPRRVRAGLRRISGPCEPAGSAGGELVGPEMSLVAVPARAWVDADGASSATLGTR